MRLKRYATATYVDVAMLKRAVQDLALGADWTPAAGDVKVSIDGGTAANIGTLPTAIAMGNTAYWRFPIAAGEVTGKTIMITVGDNATKAVEDQAIAIETYGHRLAEHPNLGVPTPIYFTFATAGGLAVEKCGTGITGYTADQLLRRPVKVLSGAANGEQVVVADFAVTNGVITFSPPLTTAPANGDEGVIL